jgi:hypothetical protein
MDTIRVKGIPKVKMFIDQSFFYSITKYLPITSVNRNKLQLYNLCAINEHIHLLHSRLIQAKYNDIPG